MLSCEKPNEVYNIYCDLLRMIQDMNDAEIQMLLDHIDALREMGDIATQFLLDMIEYVKKAEKANAEISRAKRLNR